MLASLCSLTKRYLHWSHWKSRRMSDCTHIRQPWRQKTHVATKRLRTH